MLGTGKLNTGKLNVKFQQGCDIRFVEDGVAGGTRRNVWQHHIGLKVFGITEASELIAHIFETAQKMWFYSLKE